MDNKKYELALLGHAKLVAAPVLVHLTKKECETLASKIMSRYPSIKDIVIAECGIAKPCQQAWIMATQELEIDGINYRNLEGRFDLQTGELLTLYTKSNTPVIYINDFGDEIEEYELTDITKEF